MGIKKVIREKRKEDYKNWSIKALLKRKEETEEYIASARRTLKGWNSLLGRLGLEASIKANLEILNDINSELVSRDERKDD